MNTHEPTAFERLGGESGIRTAVDRFYARVLADPRLTPYFEGAEVERLKASQGAFLSAVLGGPGRYTGPSITEAHTDRRIPREAFDSVLDHMVDALGDLSVDSDIIERIVQTLASLEGEVVETS